MKSRSACIAPAGISFGVGLFAWLCHGWLPDYPDPMQIQPLAGPSPEISRPVFALMDTGVLGNRRDVRPEFYWGNRKPWYQMETAALPEFVVRGHVRIGRRRGFFVEFPESGEFVQVFEDQPGMTARYGPVYLLRNGEGYWLRLVSGGRRLYLSLATNEISKGQLK